MKMLLRITLKEEIFDDEERFQAQEWLTIIEGTRVRRNRHDIYNIDNMGTRNDVINYTVGRGGRRTGGPGSRGGRSHLRVSRGRGRGGRGRGGRDHDDGDDNSDEEFVVKIDGRKNRAKKPPNTANRGVGRGRGRGRGSIRFSANSDDENGLSDGSEFDEFGEKKLKSIRPSSNSSNRGVGRGRGRGRGRGNKRLSDTTHNEGDGESDNSDFEDKSTSNSKRRRNINQGSDNDDLMDDDLMVDFAAPVVTHRGAVSRKSNGARKAFEDKKRAFNGNNDEINLDGNNNGSNINSINSSPIHKKRRNSTNIKYSEYDVDDIEGEYEERTSGRKSAGNRRGSSGSRGGIKTQQKVDPNFYDDNYDDEVKNTDSIEEDSTYL
jgi:hypothetical protein